MIWKILKSEFKQWQLIGVITVMLLGFSIILLAARFYTDIRPMFRGSDLWQHEHIIISKKYRNKTQLLNFWEKEKNQVLVTRKLKRWKHNHL